MPADYVPYGPEWEAEMMRMRKVDLVDMVRRACTKEENGSSHNTASTPLKCVHCGVNNVSDFCVACVTNLLKESNAL
jgi:hypothetical protein